MQVFKFNKKTKVIIQAIYRYIKSSTPRALDIEKRFVDTNTVSRTQLYKILKFLKQQKFVSSRNILRKTEKGVYIQYYITPSVN